MLLFNLVIFLLINVLDVSKCATVWAIPEGCRHSNLQNILLVYKNFLVSKCMTARWLCEDVSSMWEYTSRVHKEVHKNTYRLRGTFAKMTTYSKYRLGLINEVKLNNDICILSHNPTLISYLFTHLYYYDIIYFLLSISALSLHFYFIPVIKNIFSSSEL